VGPSMTMELREFAERILFATTLDDKLSCPTTITDERRGVGIVAPVTPNRPAGLQFKQRGSREGEFPGAHRLEKESERGRLLHFFANHELLATELMALALLKFPDAPAAFRRGLLQTLKDEQEHTRLYIERMRACGIEFGDNPVSGYFWRAIAGMEHPIDYVAGLSLTFEQANLDFARHFAQGFAAVGDSETAALLDRIYRDEIGHVAYGLKWFRRWKNPASSDWEAFCRQLKFPLSPNRAKGSTWNPEGRRAAGLEPAFIEQLRVFSQSKGRTPSVFVFNPFVEERIARGPSFTPGKRQAQLARDLANLPQYLGRRDDIVLVPQRPSVAFLDSLQRAGLPLPEFVELRDGCLSPDSNLAERKLGALRPWAWGPDSVDLLRPLFSKVTGVAPSPLNGERAGVRGETVPAGWEEATATDVLTPHPHSLSPLRGEGDLRGDRSVHPASLDTPSLQQSEGLSSSNRSREQSLFTSAATIVESRFNSDLARLYSKEWSAAFLMKVLKQIGAKPWLCTANEVGVVATTTDEAFAAITAIRRRGHHRVVVKEAFGFAGHNMLRLWEPEILETQRCWIDNVTTAGRAVVVEPWLERVMDFSVQLERTRDGLSLRGYTGLLNDQRGQFEANWADSTSRRRIPGDLPAEFVKALGAPASLYGLYREIFALLEAELKHFNFVGPLGIDALVYRTDDGDLRLKPVVEINPRYTMGRVTLELMRHVCPGATGVFEIVNRARLRKEGFESFAAYSRAMAEQSPLRLEGSPVQRIREGTLCLNDPGQAQEYLAVLRVGRSLVAVLPSRTFAI